MNTDEVGHSCRTETATVNRMEKAGPFGSLYGHQSVASPSLLVAVDILSTICGGFMGLMC